MAGWARYNFNPFGYDPPRRKKRKKRKKKKPKTRHDWPEGYSRNREVVVVQKWSTRYTNIECPPVGTVGKVTGQGRINYGESSDTIEVEFEQEIRTPARSYTSYRWNHVTKREETVKRVIEAKVTVSTVHHRVTADVHVRIKMGDEYEGTHVVTSSLAAKDADLFSGTKGTVVGYGAPGKLRLEVADGTQHQIKKTWLKPEEKLSAKKLEELERHGAVERACKAVGLYIAGRGVGRKLHWIEPPYVVEDGDEEPPVPYNATVFAAELGGLAMVKDFAKQKAELWTGDELGWTPLMI